MTRSQFDIIILFSTRIIRLFGYGFLSVILVLYLVQIGLSEQEVGLLLTLTLLGDAGISLWMTTSADRIGRRKMLILGSLLIIFSGILFITTDSLILLIFSAIIGVISPSGNEIGPFLSIEQATLSQLLPDKKRTHTFGWYVFAGSLATALGSLGCGLLVAYLQQSGLTPLESYRVVFIGYIISGMILFVLFLSLSPAVEVTVTQSPRVHYTLGLHQSKTVVAKLSVLFALDAFAGGFVVQTIVAYWFYLKFGVSEETLGILFFVGNILAGFSALLATHLATRIGLINTMVFTHLPSNILLCLVPFMPNLSSAIVMLLLRFSISQMDIPARQSYTMAVVTPDERSAASGVTTIARSIGASLSPVMSGYFLANPLLFAAPFLVAGGLKIIYDLLLYQSFKALKPPEEV
ncbi:MAG: MFS transporter [Beggiatoa sp. IS2]|nr:MAG: MFS transporter [Beggiatoa sp. IS2]